MRGDRHLGERAAALVDGELGAQARDLALAHLARCDDCRAEVAVQRRLKARLSGLTPPPQSPDLTARLTGIGDRPAASGARAPGRDRTAGRPGSPRPPGPGGRRRPAGRPRRRMVRLAVAGGASLVALGVTAFAAGGSGAPAVVPDVHQLTVEHASTTGEVPFEVPIPAPGATFAQVSAP
ncbi:MAG: anti-sigma factor family protein [Frankiaceae bacterium]